MHFTAGDFEKKSKSWNPSELDVDLSGKVCIVTGANSGLGFATSKELAKRNATVHMISRNKEKGEAALQTIRAETGNVHITLHVVDVSRPSEIERFGEEFKDSGSSLYCLVHNAGSLDHERVETPDHIEMTFATHVLGPFLLTEYLMPVLQRSAPSRVITVSSGGMYLAPMQVDNFQSDKRRYDGLNAYSRAKRCQVYLTEYWTKKYGNSGVTFNSMHPGWCRTPGVDKSLPGWFQKLNLRSPEQGADTIVWLAISPVVATTSGRFWFDRQPAQTDFPLAKTQAKPEEIEELYKYCSTFLKTK
jgi:dehydrogenase/reductase SDR family protein 12